MCVPRAFGGRGMQVVTTKEKNIILSGVSDRTGCSVEHSGARSYTTERDFPSFLLSSFLPFSPCQILLVVSQALALTFDRLTQRKKTRTLGGGRLENAPDAPMCIALLLSNHPVHASRAAADNAARLFSRPRFFTIQRRPNFSQQHQQPRESHGTLVPRVPSLSQINITRIFKKKILCLRFYITAFIAMYES